jgi:hypothetical protein
MLPVVRTFRLKKAAATLSQTHRSQATLFLAAWLLIWRGEGFFDAADPTRAESVD